MKYKKYYRKTSLKQRGVGDFFLNEVLKKKPKCFSMERNQSVDWVYFLSSLQQFIKLPPKCNALINNLIMDTYRDKHRLAEKEFLSARGALVKINSLSKPSFKEIDKNVLIKSLRCIVRRLMTNVPQ